MIAGKTTRSPRVMNTPIFKNNTLAQSMKKKTMAIAALTPVMALSLLGINAASAQALMPGMMLNLNPDQIVQQQQNMFQYEAQLLGVSIDDVKNAWAAGKTMKQLAQDKGITPDQIQAKIKDTYNQKLKTELQTLVDKGIITQSQADQRLQTMQNKFANGRTNMGRKMFRGMNF